jgi:ketosteroid isomerase-like protein
MSVGHSADEEALLQLEQVWVRAEIEKDTATLRRILDDRFIATFTSGRTIDKAAFIAVIVGDGSSVMHSHDLTDRSMIVDADTAVIVDTDTMRGTRNGEPYTAKARVTAVYIKRDGAWRILAEHLAARTDAT